MWTRFGQNRRRVPAVDVGTAQSTCSIRSRSRCGLVGISRACRASGQRADSQLPVKSNRAWLTAESLPVAGRGWSLRRAVAVW